jgi:hypothetical protein
MSLRQSSIVGDGMSDLHVLQDMIARELATQYDLIIFRNMTPLRFGYPMHRPRMGEFAMVTVLTFVFFCSSGQVLRDRHSTAQQHGPRFCHTHIVCVH